MNTTAASFKRAGTCLQQQDLRDMSGDLAQIIRDQLFESVAIALDIGYLLGRSGRR